MTTKTAKKNFDCTVCGKTFISLSKYTRHEETKIHQRNLKNNSNNSPSPSNSNNSSPSNSPIKSNSQQQEEPQQEPQQQPIAPTIVDDQIKSITPPRKSPKVYNCLCCGYVSGNKHLYERHLKSEKHKKNSNAPPSNVFKEIVDSKRDVIINKKPHIYYDTCPKCKCILAESGLDRHINKSSICQKKSNMSIYYPRLSNKRTSTLHK